MKRNKVLLTIILVLTMFLCSCAADELGIVTIDETVRSMIEYMEYSNCYISKLGDYSECKTKPAIVTKDEIEKVIQEYVDKYPKEILLDKTLVELNDLLIISYEIVDQSKSVLQVERQVVKAGTVNFDSIIEQSVIGKSVGKPYTINYVNSNMGLLEATCTITPLYIYSLEKAELNDSFVQTHFDYESVEEWTAAIKKELEQRKLHTAWTSCLNTIIEKCSFVLNEEVLLKKATNLVYEVELQSNLENITLEKYIEQTMQISKEEFYTKCYLSCQRDVQEYLIIGAIASFESLTVTDQEFSDYCIENELNISTLPDEEKQYVIYYVLRDKVIHLLCS